MGIYIDPSTGLLYSVGEDKRFKVFDYAKNDVIAGIIPLLLNKTITQLLDLAPGNSGFTNLVAHVEAKRIFLSNRAGQVYVYDISTV